MAQQKLSLRYKIILLNGILLIVLLGYLLYLNYEINRVKVNGTIYHSIVQSKNVIADVLPPPEYIVESHLITYQLLVTYKHRDNERDALIQKLHELNDHFEKRHQYWVTTLQPGEIKTLLVDKSYQPATLYYRSLFNEFIPLLSSGDTVGAERILDTQLNPLYRTHREQIDRLVIVADQVNLENESFVEQIITRSKITLLGIWLAIFSGLIFALNKALLNPVMNSLNMISRLAGQIGSGKYDCEIPNNDTVEFTRVLHAIEQMTHSIKKEISERIRLQNNLKEKMEELNTILDNSSVGIALVRDEYLAWTNRRMGELFGYTIEEMTNKKTNVIFTAQEIYENMRADAYPVLVAGNQYISELELRRSDDSLIWIRLSAKSILANNSIISTIWVLEDITEQKRIEAELRHAKEVAEAANHAKSEFVSNMSHEIRTPMNGIIGLTHLALRTDLSLQQRDYLDKIQHSAHALLIIINDILDFSKIEAGRLQLESIDFDIDRIFSDVVNLVGQQALEKSLELVIRHSPEVPAMLVGDPLRLSQILINLASNAIKFTEHGYIVIGVEPHTGGTQPAWKFYVKDTGIGMTPEQINQLFQPFTQGDASTTRCYGGTGLGLAISKRLAEMMEGSIEVSSHLGQGSIISVILPLPSARSSPRAQFGSQYFKSLRAIVADDNPIALQAIVETLKSFGITATGVDNGTAAIEAVRQARKTNQPYTLVFVDWQMPGMDGFELIRRLRVDDHENKLVFIMITGHDREEILHQLPEVRPEGFLLKPITPSLLFDKITESLNVSVHHLHGSSSDAREVRPSPLQHLTILVVEDNPINQQVAAEILGSAGASVSVATNGLEALEQLATQSFDLVLMDIQMPEMDGYQTTRAIRADNRLSNLPVIAMTAHAMSQDKEMCLAAGMNDHVIKPIDPDQLFEVIRRWT